MSLGKGIIIVNTAGSPAQAVSRSYNFHHHLPPPTQSSRSFKTDICNYRFSIISQKWVTSVSTCRKIVKPKSIYLGHTSTLVTSCSCSTLEGDSGTRFPRQIFWVHCSALRCEVYIATFAMNSYVLYRLPKTVVCYEYNFIECKISRYCYPANTVCVHILGKCARSAPSVCLHQRRSRIRILSYLHASMKTNSLGNKANSGPLSRAFTETPLRHEFLLSAINHFFRAHPSLRLKYFYVEVKQPNCYLLLP